MYFRFLNLLILHFVVFVSNVDNLPLTPLTAATAIDAAGKLTVPANTVKPLEAVNKFELVIVFDDKAPVHVIVLLDKEPVLLIVLDCNVFKVDGPKTLNDDVVTLSV